MGATTQRVDGEQATITELLDNDNNQPDDDTTSADPAASQTAGPASRGRARQKATAVAVSMARWWAFTKRPMSLRTAWRLSGVVDARRIPAESHLLAALWWWSNRTDRVLLFLLIILAPTFMTGPLLWCAVRPTRRWGLYLIVALVLVVVPSVAGG